MGIYIILRYVNTEPSLRSNSLKGVTTSLYDPYGIMKSVLYRWNSYMGSAVHPNEIRRGWRDSL